MIIFSAPSGSGKSTIINYLLQQGLPLQFSISATSRAPRGEETNGQEYYFLTPDEFKQKIADNEFIEYEEVYKDRFYGTLRSEVKRIQANFAHTLRKTRYGHSRNHRKPNKKSGIRTYIRLEIRCHHSQRPIGKSTKRSLGYREKIHKQLIVKTYPLLCNENNRHFFRLFQSNTHRTFGIG